MSKTRLPPGSARAARKAMTAFLAAIALLISVPRGAFACSSFADYRGRPMYGMNFDYPQTAWRFMVYETKQGRVLSLEFLDGKDWVPTASLNDRGLFVATQLQLPARPPKATLGKGEERVAGIGIWVVDSSTAEEVVSRAGSVRLVDGVPSVHHLFAGKDGAAIVEAGAAGNYVRRSAPGDFLVMTNYALSKFDGAKPESTYGAGADRYQTLTRELTASTGGVGVREGMAALSKVAVSAGSYPTLCSMVVDPESLTVRVAGLRDWDKTWTISLPSGTIAPDWAPEATKPIRIRKNGVTSGDLAEWNPGVAEPWAISRAHPAAIALAIVAALCVFAGLSLARRKKRK